MSKTIRKYVSACAGVLFKVSAVLIIAIFLCNICKWVLESRDDVVILTKDGSELPKVILADACNLSGSQCIPNVALVEGKINEGTLSSLNTFIQNNSSIDVNYICFHTGGGKVESAREIADIIKRDKLSTCLAERYIVKNNEGKEFTNTQCGSSCNYLLLASNDRVAIGNQFKVVTHSAGRTVSLCFCDKTFEASSSHLDLFKEFVTYPENKDIDKHIAFIKFGAAIENDNPRALTLDEIDRYAIFTRRLN